MRLAAMLVGLGFFALAGCDGGAQSQQQFEPPPSRLPAKICADVGSALAKIRQQAGIDIQGPAEATIAEAGWLAVGAPQRDRIVTLLAFGAACDSPAPQREITVTIRNEFGRSLMQRTVPVTATLEDFDEE